MRGADALVRALRDGGCDVIFALSGNQIMPIFDACIDAGIRLVHTRHEAAAVYMAESYAQLTGRTGVALVTAGGGLGNAVGALIAARASDTPVLLLSGDSPVDRDGCGAFQEMDQTGMSAGQTKQSRRVLRSDNLSLAVADAMQLAHSGRPGPVHLALPADVLVNETAVVVSMCDGAAQDVPMPDLSRLSAAARPLVLLGPSLTETRAPGLRHALQDRLQAPVIAMESPRGLNDPALGRLKQVAQQADHVVCIGKCVDFTLSFGAVEAWPAAAFWDLVLGDQADLERAQTNLKSRLGGAVLGDAHSVAQRLVQAATPQPNREGWIKTVSDLTAERAPRGSAPGILPIDICNAVQAVLRAASQPILICDGGEFGQWAQSGTKAARRVINGVSGMIGGGVGYAMGAKAADPEATVIAMMGDGTVGFHLAEFETAVREKLPFIAVVGNDQRWNAEHLIQMRSFGPDRLIGCDLGAARYDLAVVGLGGFGVHVTERNQLAAALHAAVNSGLPACVNVQMQGMAAPVFET